MAVKVSYSFESAGESRVIARKCALMSLGSSGSRSASDAESAKRKVAV